METKLLEINVQELTWTEKVITNGGGETWKWLGRVIGFTSDFFSGVCEAWSSTPEGAAAQQALRDFQ